LNKNLTDVEKSFSKNKLFTLKILIELEFFTL